MKLLHLKIHKASTCGGLLDGLSIKFREDGTEVGEFDPLCLVGPNGSGKSQLLQVLAEIFQLTYHVYLPDQEKGTPNDGLEFEIKYKIQTEGKSEAIEIVRISNLSKGGKKTKVLLETLVDGKWEAQNDSTKIDALLPSKVVGYTSGDNETLSLPFFSSRAGYAEKVRTNALDKKLRAEKISDSRLLLIDYGTNLEVLVANLLLNPEKVKEALQQAPNLKSLRSFRCVIQLNHSAGPSDGIKVTEELESYIEYLKSCATCFDYDKSKNSYVFDFYVDKETTKAFESYWPAGALELYSCFHKLAMLNDLIIPRDARKIYEKNVKERRFATRLPEPFDAHKVFRFERVEFISKKSNSPVDYVSLSDGEHQLAQLLGTACMASFPNVLFLLDEPESHFNPQWRVEFTKKLINLPTKNGDRTTKTDAAQQECLVTTHSPFVPSDIRTENVLIFKKVSIKSLEVRRPKIKTYGSRFDAILAECFEISPPISALPRDYIDRLMADGTAEEIDQAISELGESTARMRLAARLSQLSEGKK